MSLFDKIEILSYGKNPAVMIHTNNSEHNPDDYYKGNWSVAKSKKTKYFERKKMNQVNNEKNEIIRKIKEKKIEERKNAKLWYNENTWQFKVLNNKYAFSNGETLVEKYNLESLVESYSRAKNNYRKNGISSKLMKIIPVEDWKKIQNNLTESE